MIALLLLSLSACQDTKASDPDPDTDCELPQTWYPDADQDGFGDLSAPTQSCTAPAGAISVGGDCRDDDPDIHPDAQELCDGYDNDCDGLIDDQDSDTDLSVPAYWADADQDGYGDPALPHQGSCTPPPGYVDNDQDCQDGDPGVNPVAEEICDGQDNDCDGEIDEDLGEGQACAAASCAELNDGESASGLYQIDPVGWTDGARFDPELAAPFAAWCDMESDGGGWTLVSWTGDSTQLTENGLAGGVPYPGLAVCPELSCSRGSAADNAQLQALIQHAGELGLGHSQSGLESFQALAAYDYAAAYDYGDLSLVQIPLESAHSCDPESALAGRVRVLAGPTDYHGVSVYMAPSMRYGSYAYTEGSNYIWNIADPEPCSGAGLAPSAYLGTWSAQEYGPYLSKSAGARSLWVR